MDIKVKPVVGVSDNYCSNKQGIGHHERKTHTSMFEDIFKKECKRYTTQKPEEEVHVIVQV